MSKPLTPTQEQKDTIAMFEHMAKAGGGPAAPLQIQYGTLENGSPAVWFAIGLTKRERFAMAALEGYLGSFGPEDFVTDGSEERVAKKMYRIADAMVAEGTKSHESQKA